MRPQPEKAGPGQESVWDYPRPPRLERTLRRIRAVVAGVTIADSRAAWRVLETSHPPTYYLPSDDVRMDLLQRSEKGSHCEWKGRAHYYDALVDGVRVASIAWAYATPTKDFEAIRGHLAFYLPRLDEGLVEEERAVAQPGGFYGGWITSDLAGPFKGASGSWGW